MAEKLFIRLAIDDDLELLLALFRQLHPDDASLPLPDATTLWKAMLNDESLSTFVGVVGDRLVVTCTLVMVRNLTRGGRPYGLIENVVTDSEHRRHGHGRAILRHALEYAWKKDCYKVMLLTGSKREETLRFYQNAGFRLGVKTGLVAVQSTDE